MPSRLGGATPADNHDVPKKEKPPPEPDDLVRESAGAYVSGDRRFRVSQSDASWFVVDAEQANEFGQELIHGPFSSLKQAQAALAGARAVKPLLRSTPRPKRPIRADDKPQPKRTQEPPAPPPSWIDRLDETQQKAVRRLIRALEKEGLADAEELVRRHRDDPTPTIATRVVEHRLDQLIEAQPDEGRAAAKELVRRVTEILSVDGLATSRPLPRWVLVEIGPDEPAPKRVIKLRR